MTIAIHETIPAVTIQSMGESGPQAVDTDALLKGKTVALFGLPGAYTPTCSNRHLPGYIENTAALKAKGIDTIACISVNDAFVMDAWGKAHGAGDAVMMLADGNGDFAKATGLELDLHAAGMGMRSTRFSMLVEDGVVKALHVEDNPGEATVSSAEHMLASL